MFFFAGTYFSSGSSKRKLDYYLVFLQAYYWFKKSLWKESFPPLLDHMFKETLTLLRPKLKLLQSYEETLEEVNNIKKTLGVGKKVFKNPKILYHIDYFHNPSLSFYIYHFQNNISTKTKVDNDIFHDTSSKLCQKVRQNFKLYR